MATRLFSEPLSFRTLDKGGSYNYPHAARQTQTDGRTDRQDIHGTGSVALGVKSSQARNELRLATTGTSTELCQPGSWQKGSLNLKPCRPETPYAKEGPKP